MGFVDGQAAYEQKKLELHAKLDQTKKVAPATVSLVRSRLSPQEVARRPGDKNISILHLSCRTSDLQLSLVLQTHAHKRMQ